LLPNTASNKPPFFAWSAPLAFSGSASVVLGPLLSLEHAATPMALHIKSAVQNLFIPTYMRENVW
jgi:hypothetical protein